MENRRGEYMSEKLKQLENILGKNRIIKAPNILKFYTSDESSFSQGRIPICVIKPKNTSEVQTIVNFSNEYKIPITLASSNIHFYGRTIPIEGCIMIDLNEMNQIIKIDGRNKSATVEPGVSFSQLETIKDTGLMPLFPLCPPEKKSVLTSYLEREPLLIPKLEYYEPILTMEVILPTGEILRTGSAAVMPSKFADYVVPFGPGLNWNQIFQGAQGTLGIITSATIKIEHLPKLDKTYFLTSNRLEDLIDPLYEIQRYLIGYECLIINDLNLAMMLVNYNENIKNVRQKLSPWTLILCLSGGVNLPEEKIKQEEEDFIYSLNEFKINPSTTLAGLEKSISSMLRQSYKGKFWKLKWKSNFQDIFFITTLNKVPTFLKILGELSSDLNYPLEEIGCYIQPIARGGACHMEFTLFYNSSNNRQNQMIKNFYQILIKNLFDMGAFFSRPYGSLISNITYQKNLTYSRVLRNIKEIFDPNNILNPGKLNFNGGDKYDA